MKQTEQEPGDMSSERAGLRTSRRAILRGGAGAAGVGMLAAVEVRVHPAQAQAGTSFIPRSEHSSAAATDDLAVFPLHKSKTASPGTEISFRGAIDGLGDVQAVGSRSGVHTGFLISHSDGKGASFVPDVGFREGENVTVQAGMPLSSAADGALVFTIGQPTSPAKAEETADADPSKLDPQSFRSRPDLTPTSINVTDPPKGAAPGYILIGPRQPGGQSGPMMIDDSGEVIWFRPLPGAVETAACFTSQDYHGEPVLTWWEGVITQGHGFGHLKVVDQTYKTVATVRAGNGYAGCDLHDFLLTPQGTALIPIYNTMHWNLEKVGGPKDGVVMDGIVQEIDIETGRVLFEWHSLDHVGLTESYIELPPKETDTFDYFHLNSVEVDTDGNIVVNARNTWAAYKIDRKTGKIIWRYNGKKSDFKMGKGTKVSFQHDARVHPNNQLTFFNNAANSPDANVASRGVRIDLDMEGMTATLAQEFVHPTKIVSTSQGNNQVLPNNNAFIGWGSAPVFTEFSPDGDVVFNARFPQGVTSYRAYRLPWVGQPAEAPAVAAEQGEGTHVKVYASWNGATEVAKWQVFAGDNADNLQPIGSAPRKGFETTISVNSEASMFAAQAQDKAGKVLGLSEAVKPKS
ncbi:MAG: arylsulfotransferase family protein [Thermomicrobiales bacterium]